ncbi:L-serine ammonia-lyase, iron-sulfur-dependent subunit beta [Diplocloster modestus]|uniref:L-serine deaminase n=1 Tax=Diplocloster modestus TaxID=2850322 RepID=A0ABS6KAJ4_9FIRM|nr:L-serine ammonia-lyase, iron-sulfur-dependent subunit beta [Diplocloster modestus]MBU9727512.1 L-serine ammonia-lyase, iron-sulfur-dependent subunit beta [Diplocloster modestus]
MNLFEILGPVMVGPSSSHTAGAVRIGYVTRKLLGEEPAVIEMLLHGSFAATGKGHGTDCALVAGLLGMQSDDMRIPTSMELARERGIAVSIREIRLKEAHPNTVVLKVSGVSGKFLQVEGCSLGGGRISIRKLDGIKTDFTGDSPTLIVQHIDQPGHVAEITSMLAHKSVNIATLHLYRDSRGGRAVMVVETDQPIPQTAIRWAEHLEGVLKVTYLNTSEEDM